MSMPGGAQYLPPVVTQLLGDASDLLRAFAEAKAAQKAFTAGATDMSDKVHASTTKAGRDVDEFTDLVVRKMHAGESAAAVLKRSMRQLGDEVHTLRRRLGTEGAHQGLYVEFRRASDELARMRNLARRIAPELLEGARTAGQRFGLEFAGAFAGMGKMIIPAIIAMIVLASPVIASLIGAAVAVGVGLGFAGIGVLIAALLLPGVKKQFAVIGGNFKKAFLHAVTGGFDDALGHALGEFNRMIPTFGAQLRRIFDSIAPALVPLSDALAVGLKLFLAEMMQIIPQIMPALLTFIQTIPDMMEAVAMFLVAITKDGPALSRFILDAANAIMAFLEGSAKVIAWLEAAYLWIVKLNDAFPIMGWQRQVIGLGIAIEAVKNFFVDLWSKIVGAAKAVGSWFADLGRAIWGWLTDAGGAVADWFNATVRWFQLLPGRVVGFLASMPARVTAVVSRMAHQALFWVGWLVGQWYRFMTEAPGKIVAAVAFAWAWISRKFSEGVAATIANIRAFPGQVASFFAALWASVTAWVARTWSSVTSWFARTRQDMINKILSGINAVIGFFKTLPGRAGAEAKSFKDRIVAFFSGAKDWLFSAGQAIVRGIISGVSSLWGWAVDKVRSFASDILSGFKRALGISSPAKAFEGPGEMSALGYERGWVKAMRRVRRTFSGPATADIIFSGAPGGAPRRPGTPAPGGAAPGPMMVHTVVKVGDRAVVDAITPASQRRGARNGITGTGVPTARIM